MLSNEKNPSLFTIDNKKNETNNSNNHDLHAINSFAFTGVNHLLFFYRGRKVEKRARREGQIRKGEK